MRPVTFSDDSMLALFALLRGRVVQQPSAVAFSTMPHRTSHHVRQYLRWMRGSTIRAIWRARYLPLHHPAYIAQVIRYFQQVLYLLTLGWALATAGHARGLAPLWLTAVPLAVAYGQTLRYLSVGRSDRRLRFQLVSWLLTPVALAWAWFVLRPLRWYGALTCWRTVWGTRQNGPEQTAGPDSGPARVQLPHPAAPALPPPSPIDTRAGIGRN